MEITKSSAGDSTTSHQRNKSRRNIENPRQYADAVDSYSKLSTTKSLYTGPHYKNLATYLQLPFELRAPDLVPKKSNNQVKENYKFVSLYDLDPNSPKRVRHISNINEFEAESNNLLSNTSYGHLVFMRGHPSPEWLLAIGVRYQVDPEFFQRHLDFRHGQLDHFPLPSLPSTSTSMMKLRITTMGDSRSEFGTDHSEEALESLRTQNIESMDTYLERLKSHSNSRLGDSIVRKCSIHDMRHFTIEQDISIYISKCEKSWTCLIWLDNGNDLSDGFASWLKSPLRTVSWRINYIPVIQHKPSIALMPRSRLVAPLDGNESATGKIPQSAALLHLDYGRNLDRNIAAVDSFYVLHELLSFASFSEVQFLNMLETKFQRELDQTILVRQKNHSISNLLYNQQVLDRHIHRIRENLTTLQARNSSFPRGALDSENQRKADTAATSLLQDYEYLLSRAQSLSEQCNRGMQVVMNNAMIKESQDAISQAKGVAKLTRLAFIFIPMGFTCSFFGMNFAIFGQGELSIWVWFVASLPVFALSVVFMNYEVADTVKEYLRARRQARKRTKNEYDFSREMEL